MIVNYRIVLYNITHNHSAPPDETYDQGGSSKTQHRPLLQAASKTATIIYEFVNNKKLKMASACNNLHTNFVFFCIRPKN